jgi:outer membrane immunogenic protein
MKKILLSTAALAAMGTVAHAADLPRRTAPAIAAPALPIFTWTGFYVGVNAGYAFSDGGTSTIGTAGFRGLVPGGIVPGSLNTRAEGFIGGAQLGYNQQFGTFVAGIEADIQFMDAGKTARFTGNPVLGTQLTTSATSEVEYLGTLRGRLGFTPFDRFLVYGTGGLAYGQVKTSGSVTGVQAPGLAWNGSNSDMKFGYAVGGGIEYAFTNNLTFKTEYLYYDLGRSTFNASGNAAVLGTAALNGVSYTGRSDTRGSIVRAGLNYKF